MAAVFNGKVGKFSGLVKLGQLVFYLYPFFKWSYNLHWNLFRYPVSVKLFLCFFLVFMIFKLVHSFFSRPSAHQHFLCFFLVICFKFLI